MTSPEPSANESEDKEHSPKPKQPEFTSKPQPTIYSYIPEGAGGTYTFCPNDEVQYIGTSKCNTCVGVYFKLSTTRCFFAHINVDCVNLTTGKWSREINPAREAVTHQVVKEKLDTEQRDSNWGPVTDEMRSSLVMTCSRFAVGRRQVGDAVVAAVLEWLGVGEVREIHRRQAFVVHLPLSRVEFFDIEAPSSQAENKAWTFVVEEEDEEEEDEEEEDEGEDGGNEHADTLSWYVTCLLPL